MYHIVIDRKAQKQLGKIPPPHFNRIIKAINELADNPRPVGYIKLTAAPVTESGLATTGLFTRLKIKYYPYLL